MIEVSLVNVDVIVTDRAGNHVRGLTAGDFELYESGELQPITNFAEYRGSGAKRVANAPSIASAPAADVAPPQKRAIVVFVDKLNVHGRERTQLFDGVKQFLRRNVRPGDAAAVVRWSAGPGSMHDFTDDVARLEASVDAISSERARVKGSEWDYIDLERTQLEWYYALGGTAGELGTSVSQYDATARVALDVRQKARVLSRLMETIGGADGQKILVMLSDRFAAHSGAEYAGLGNQVALKADVQIDEMLRMAKANGVRVYPLYARIGDMDVNETASKNRPSTLLQATQSTLRNVETSSLMNIANETGGVAGTGLGDIQRLFTGITEDLESYYSLAYRVTDAREGREKRLVVKVKNGAYRVRTRRDVVNRSAETLTRQRIVAKLLQPAHTEGFPVNVFLKKARRDEAGLLRLPLEIKLPMSALTLLPDGSKQTGGFSVYVAWAGDLATVSDITRRSQPVSVAANELAAAKSQVITYEVDIAATRSIERVVVAVVDDLSQ
ncbi:MAG TPA: VWA domain-containing protein [Thermoanaerobaculia bacterium]|nr:VWA domain-containing protein [Thermoanaerobaculia bacterium]